ncbi:MAG: hypothetical protein JWR67_2475 [Mucilaginibacter sp.]|nr:hypothetical protein [Mucilaginibacter sp.]MDB5111361.1 hypothetical protein [Mucilaginibacter sp.]
MESKNKVVSTDAMRTIKHDIKNQLSNINLLIEQLRYELKDPTAGYIDYLDMMALSTTKIDAILNNTENSTV